MRKQYSDAFVEQALIKVYSRGEGRTIRDVAGDLNVSYVTLKEAEGQVWQTDTGSAVIRLSCPHRLSLERRRVMERRRVRSDKWTQALPEGSWREAGGKLRAKSGNPLCQTSCRL